MSWLEARSSFRIALVALASLALAGCFRPVYGDRPATGVMSKSGNADVAAMMASVDVKQIDGRVGGKMRNELIFMLTGGGAAGPTAYRLKVDLSIFGRSAVVDPLANTPQSRTISLKADYELTRAGGSLDPIAKGHAFAAATYFSDLQRFANVRAERDAEDRAAVQVAQQIRTRLQSYFATGQ